MKLVQFLDNWGMVFSCLPKITVFSHSVPGGSELKRIIASVLVIDFGRVWKIIPTFSD